MAPELGANARAYHEIKQAILSGELKQRQRLDIDELARRWRVSATPVRHALAVLTAQRLVSVHASRHYHVAFWSERELGALYEWRWQLARLASETSGPQPLPPVIAGDHAVVLVTLLSTLHAKANEEVRRAAEAADERLSWAYRVEPEILGHTGRELELFAQSVAAGDVKRVQQRLRALFRRRMGECGAIRARASIKALPRNGD